MTMQFLREAGLTPVYPDRDWSPELPEPRECSKDALLGFYDVADKNFWPKKAFSGKAPEIVRIIDDNGRVVASYSIKDFIRETGRQLSPLSQSG